MLQLLPQEVALLQVKSPHSACKSVPDTVVLSIISHLKPIASGGGYGSCHMVVVHICDYRSLQPVPSISQVVTSLSNHYGLGQAQATMTTRQQQAEEGGVVVGVHLRQTFEVHDGQQGEVDFGGKHHDT